jgi:hypothetical protein
MDAMSPRQQVAVALADTCVCGDLNESYGVSVVKTKDGKGKDHWCVTFAKARYLDGLIKVYSPGFILIKWMGAAAKVSGLAFDGSMLCRSEHEAKDFIINHFVNK